MKKIMALVLVVIMAFGCMTVAFAETEKKCRYCNETFTDSKVYNEHIEICYEQHKKNVDTNESEDEFTFFDLIDNFIELFDIGTGWWDAIEDVIIRMVDFIENISMAILEKTAA